MPVFLIGGAQEATELDAKRAIDQGSRLAAVLEDAKPEKVADSRLRRLALPEGERIPQEEGIEPRCVRRNGPSHQPMVGRALGTVEPRRDSAGAHWLISKRVLVWSALIRVLVWSALIRRR